MRISGLNLAFIMLFLLGCVFYVWVQNMSWKGLFSGFWFVRIVLVLWLVSSGFIVFLLLNIDAVVNHQLYDFGLQFSTDWAVPYWNFLRLAFVCLFVPGFLSAVALVFSVFVKDSGRERLVVVKHEKVEGEASRVGPVKEGNHLLASCPKCKKVFGKPLVMLDFGGGKTRLVNVCPYCNFILGSADEKVEVGIVDLQEREMSKSK
jgi:uncharacterized Zn-finger protein